MSCGRARARRAEGQPQTITFADVAGIDEAKEELTEIVDFLKNPDKYARLGGKIPRGVLLSGAPGSADQGRARGACGGGARVRRHDDRGRVRHPAPHPDR